MPMLTPEMVILLGTMDCHFEQNFRIAVENYRAERPLFDGTIPATWVKPTSGPDRLILRPPKDT